MSRWLEPKKPKKHKRFNAYVQAPSHERRPTALPFFHRVCKIAVGGCRYSVPLAILTKRKGTTLHHMFTTAMDLEQGEQGHYTIRRDGKYFQVRTLSWSPPTLALEAVDRVASFSPPRTRIPHIYLVSVHH